MDHPIYLTKRNHKLTYSQQKLTMLKPYKYFFNISSNLNLPTVTDAFGVATYAIYLFLLTIWWSWVWGDASACPYTHMEDMVEGKTSPRIVALKTWAQIMGGCCVYRFVQVFWWMELVPTHRDRAFADCTADLQVKKNIGTVAKHYI